MCPTPNPNKKEYHMRPFNQTLIPKQSQNLGIEDKI